MNNGKPSPKEIAFDIVKQTTKDVGGALTQDKVAPFLAILLYRITAAIKVEREVMAAEDMLKKMQEGMKDEN